MKFIHFSDSHLGFAAYRKLSESGYNQREEDICSAFSQAVDKIIELNPDLVLHSGDLFDTVRPTNRIIHFALTQLLKFSAAGIPLVLISGNHETPKQRYLGHVFKILEAIKNENLHILYREELHHINIKGINVFAIPQCGKDETFQALLHEAKPIEGKKNVLMLHAGVCGMKEFSHGDFNELLVDYNYFEQKGFDYYALGHYHGYTDLGQNAYFCGSTERQSFNEAGQKKGFIEIDFNGDNRRRIVFHELDIRPMIDFPEIYADHLSANEIAEKVETNLKRLNLSGKILRQKIKNVKSAALASLDVKKIRDCAAEALHFEPVFEKSEEDRAIDPSKISIGGLNEEYLSFVDHYPGISEKERADLKLLGQLSISEELEKEV